MTTAGCREEDCADGDAEDEVREDCISKHSWPDGEKTVSERDGVVEDVFDWAPCKQEV